MELGQYLLTTEEVSIANAGTPGGSVANQSPLLHYHHKPTEQYKHYIKTK